MDLPQQQSRRQISDACLQLINSEIDYIEGCRRLVNLRDRLDLANDPDFLPFVAVASETDDYPVVSGGRDRAKELFREFDAKGVGNRTKIRDKTGGSRGVAGELGDGTPLRIRMKPDGTTRIQAGEQKFIFPPN